ncbi:uncharacterized protein LOC133835916 isoform X3 [Drosophila sulfurigaster albostrigata]|uniref:uncharacterized protein LOC133835916 isoform X3 n=1 Tax=Drosophila sulfurigaster albostrigata TaxID=89887 RepID=UPI002D219A39|nr:uncharacterized protein LOC133835916 isoform X3 [Drosophila sulfurigaster albostrigata]
MQLKPHQTHKKKKEQTNANINNNNQYNNSLFPYREGRLKIRSEMSKIWILTFIMLLHVVWVRASVITTPTPTIINDLQSSHAPATTTAPAMVVSGANVQRNETSRVTSAAAAAEELEIVDEITTSSILSSSTASSASSTSTATPTTTATTSTTTTTATTTTKGKEVKTTAAVEENVATTTAAAAVENVATAIEEDVAREKTTAIADDVAPVKTTATADVAGIATTTILPLPLLKLGSEKLTQKEDEGMTTTVPPLASLGNVFDRLYRIKFSDSAGDKEQENSESLPEADSADVDELAASASPASLNIQMQAAESYQVAETLADLNEEERKRYGAMLFQQSTASKLNIVDLYPMKLEDFQSIMHGDRVEQPQEVEQQQQQQQEQQQQAVFKQLDNAEEYRQNLMPNEVELLVVADGTPSVNQQQPTIATTTAATPMTTTTNVPTKTRETLLAGVASTPSDFTRKLLAEQDDLITEIERKFELHEARGSTTNTAATTTTATTGGSSSSSSTTAATMTSSTRSPQQLPRLAAGDSYIDRRVKKSFEFPMQHRASDVMAMPNIDFGNTKFNTEVSDGHEAKSLSAAAAAAAGTATSSSSSSIVAPSHPEFSTTKFYNSKELYNEMLLHNKRKLMKEIGTATATGTGSGKGVRLGSSSSSTVPTAGSIIKSSAATVPTERLRQSSPTTKLETTRSGSSSSSNGGVTPMPPKRVTLTPTRQTFDGATATASATATAGEAAASTIESAWTTVKPIKYQKELKRAKLLLKALMPPQQQQQQMEKLEVVAAKVKVIAQPQAAASSTLSPIPVTGQSANLGKSASKPIARPRILSRLQEKINSLECEIQNVPQDSHLWRGNETHELLLPIVTTEHCKPGEHCAPNVLTWEGEAEIQSGDILIVEINDAMLSTAHNLNNSYANSQSAAHAAQVYQVTRSGHEHCDVTEGVLLDITPLVVDGRKLVTLYDKDLTEGVNLLIVVSELWGAQCVRLKVTTKTDNCGENADCSGKGVCYSNPSMEEYECQCCSGFAGPHCEEIDACNPSPCTNNGICVDLSQGHEGNSYQCLCPYGYAGKNCQYESDPCNPAECMNGGSCVGNSTHFHCDCASGFTGPLCQHSLNECESSPCVHGICVDQEDGFRCFCQPGFSGELCNFEYNECESNPCQNAGECIDHIGSFECRCTKGYTGTRCQIKVDFCANKPCPEGHRCIDHGNDFSCECPGGRNGPDCNQMPRTCSVNPCTHGGTCWSSGESFYCACRPGYTGTMCEDEFVVETVVSSSEFIVDDVNARNFNDKTFGSSVVLKSPIELHNAYFAAGVLAAAIFIVAVVVTICHCKVNQTYRKFSTRPTSFIPILGFSRRPKLQGKLNKHWLSGKGLGTTATPAAAAAGATQGGSGSGNAAQSTRHLPAQTNGNSSAQTQAQSTLGGQLHERPFQRHLAMNLENDMYYTVDFSENSQHSPLIQ